MCKSESTLSRLFLEERIDPTKLSEFSFASRKIPEFMNHRMVRCLRCDLVYVESPPSQEVLGKAYHVASYDSAEEANDAANSYMAAFGPIFNKMPLKESALEIGTGTGVLLDLLSRYGFTNVVGVEPSAAAIAAAPESRREWIREGLFNEDDFEPASLDFICCLMTMEHVPDPRVIASAAMRLLRPGGAFVTVTHDYGGTVNRLLGKRSPIIDVEHMQLFSHKSIGYLLEASGYREIMIKGLVNSYSVGYWLRLSPLPVRTKMHIRSLLQKLRLHDRKFSMNVGNLVAAGFK